MVEKVTATRRQRRKMRLVVTNQKEADRDPCRVRLGLCQVSGFVWMIGISLEISVEKVTGLNLPLLRSFHLTARYFYLSFGDRAICRAAHVGPIYSGRARREALHRKKENWCDRCAIKGARLFARELTCRPACPCGFVGHAGHPRGRPRTGHRH